MSEKDIQETDVELSEAYLDGFFAGQEFEKAKQVKQKAFFKSICKLADKAKEVTALAGSKYKQVVLNLPKEVLEEIREWSEKE
jgi:hypothetical protein